MAHVLGNCRMCDGHGETHDDYSNSKSTDHGYLDAFWLRPRRLWYLCPTFTFMKSCILTKVTGGVIITPDFLDQLDLNGKTSLISTVTAIYDIGCFVGAILVCVIGDPLGRKNCVLLGTTIMAIGAILQIAAYGVPQMIVGRIVAGIGNGINTSTAPVWQGETSKASWRGKLVVIEMIMNIAGFSLSNWVTYGFSLVQEVVRLIFTDSMQLCWRICSMAHTIGIPVFIHHYSLCHCSVAPGKSPLAHGERAH